MLETRLREVKTEAESLYREMSGGEEISLKVTTTTEIAIAAMTSARKELYVHPDFIMPKSEAEQACLEKRSELCRLLREDEAMFARAKRAILAHEVAHLYLNHQSGIWHHHVATYLMFPSGILIIPYFTALPFFLTLLAIRKLAETILTPLRNLSEKHHEYQADLKAVETTKDLDGMMHFLKTGAPFVKGFSFSHPHPLDRIRYLREHYAS